MEVVLLGSGAADGWPNAFCDCRSCAGAAAAGQLRGQTSALVDDVIWLDPHAEAAPAAVRAGRSLAGVRHLLVTHAHVDHLAPQVLLFRGWVRDEPLEVVGPADVVAACRDWVAPGADVRWTVVTAGDELAVGEHRVRVLAAEHEVMAPGDAVLYDVTGPAGTRLLWACDTGPWPAARHGELAGAAFDLVMLEETFGEAGHLGGRHHDLTTFAQTVEAWRAVGAVTAATQVVAVHLSHHNPPEAELVERLARVGARPGHDGEVIVCRDESVAVPTRPGTPRSGPWAAR